MLIGGLACLGWSLALVYFDVTEQRLPNALTLPAGALAIVLCFFYPVGAWGLLWPCVFLCVGAGIGGGDVKLAVPLGVICALAAGFPGVLVVVLLSSLFTVISGLILRVEALAHGPAMIAATWLVGLYGSAQIIL